MESNMQVIKMIHEQDLMGHEISSRGVHSDPIVPNLAKNVTLEYSSKFSQKVK